MLRFPLAALLLAPLLSTAQAPPPQQWHELKALRLEDGSTLTSCKIGYRTYGALNPARDNAVLFPTWFTGNSSQLAALIGPGRLVDPSRHFIITVDALGNGVSCSPSHSAITLPNLTIADMVQSQHRLVTEHFKISRLHAVIGISMGGMQSFQWMVAHPGFAGKIVTIIGSPRLNNSDLLLWQAELSAIEAMQKSGADPRAIMPAVEMIQQFALYTPEYRAAQTASSSFEALKASIERDSTTMDPRDWAAQLRAMMTHDIFRRFSGDPVQAAAAVAARVLVVIASQDHMVHPQPARDFARLAGFSLLELTGSCGHMAPFCESARLYDAVNSFLAAP